MPINENLLQLNINESRGGKGSEKPGSAWASIMAQISSRKGIDEIVK